MKKLLSLSDESFGLDTPKPETYYQRQAARCIVLDEEGKVGLIYSPVNNYYKIAGGGVEKDEDLEEAMKREVREEVGCSVTGVRELGYIEEFRDQRGLHQTSYCYTARIDGDKHAPNFDESEKSEGFAPVWLDIDEAINALSTDVNNADYEIKFMTTRDLTFLHAAKQHMDQN